MSDRLPEALQTTLSELLLPPPGKPLFLKGHCCKEISPTTFYDTTTRYLAECRDYLQHPALLSEKTDIDASDLIIPSMKDSVLSAISKVEKRFNVPRDASTAQFFSARSNTVNEDKEEASLHSQHSAKVRLDQRISDNLFNLNTDRDPLEDPLLAEDPLEELLAENIEDDNGQAAASDDDGAGRNGNDVDNVDAGGGAVETSEGLESLINIERTSVIQRLKPFEGFVMERVRAAKRAKVDYEDNFNDGKHHIRCLAMTGKSAASRLMELGGACEVTRGTSNFASRPMQIYTGNERRVHLADPAATPLKTAVEEYNDLVQKYDARRYKNTLPLQPTVEVGSILNEEHSATVRLDNTENVQSNDLVLSISVYHPSHPKQKTQEFLVLGSQCLCELKDQIYCLRDHKLSRMMSSEAESPISAGFFFFGRVFYNDMRDAEAAVDYSRPILESLNAIEPPETQDLTDEDSAKDATGECCPEWKKLPEEDVMDLDSRGCKSEKMENFKFKDIPLNIGASGIYCHLGGCEHRIVVTDIRLVHPEDVSHQFEYPLLVFQSRFHSRRCSICDTFFAKIVTHNDQLAPHSPAYFCLQCYEYLHGPGEVVFSDPREVFDDQQESQGSLSNVTMRVLPYFHE